MIDPSISLGFRPPQIDSPLATGLQAQQLQKLRLENAPENQAAQQQLRLAQIYHLMNAPASEKRLQEQADHKRSVQDTIGFLSIGEQNYAAAWPQFRAAQIARDPNAAAVLPEQFNPVVLPGLQSFAMGGLTSNALNTKQQTAAAAPPAAPPIGTTAAAPTSLAALAGGVDPTSGAIVQPFNPAPQAPPVALAPPTALPQGPQTGTGWVPGQPSPQAAAPVAAPPVEVSAPAPVETSDALRLKAQAADKEADRQRSLGTTVGNKNAVQAKVDARNFRSAAAKLDSLAQQEEMMANRISIFKEKQKEKADLDMPDDVAKAIARQYVAGDRSVLIGLARNSRGMITARTAIVKELKSQGKSPEEMAATIAEFEGIKSGERTLGNRQAQVGVAVEEARNMAPLALAASEKVDRTRYPLLNRVILAAEQGTGDENVVRLGIAVNSLINIYARAINPVGQVTVSDKDHARELLSTAWSKGQFRQGIDQLQLEMNAAYKAPGSVRKELRRAVTGEPEPIPQRRESDKTPVGGGGWKIEKVK